MNKPISLKKNTIANYIGQFYTMSIGLIITPLYLKYLGAEAYGLVGFFTMLITWLNLLDIGLTPTLGRQAAYIVGHRNRFLEFRKLLKSFEVIFLILSLIIGLIIYFSSNWIALEWLKVKLLPIETVSYCVSLMGIIFGLRWFAGLYKSGINGFENQVLLNIINILIMSLRYIGALIILIFVTQDIEHFFEYQLIIGLIELFLLMKFFYKKLPIAEESIGIISFHFDSIKVVMPFALGIAYTAGIWVFVSQIDKLVLSSVLTLSDYGYFSLIVLISSALLNFNAPITQAIQPRMTSLFSQNKELDMVILYKSSTQIQVLISMSMAITIALYSKEFFYSWTGNLEAASWAENILFWFVLGNAVLILSGTQYGLQVAYGKLKLHVIGTTIGAIIDIPIIIYVALHYGALGAGIAWFVLRVIWFIVWVPIVHNYISPKLHIAWLKEDVAKIVLGVTFIALLLYSFNIVSVSDSRLIIFLKLIIIGFITLFFSSFFSSVFRIFYTKLWKGFL